MSAHNGAPVLKGNMVSVPRVHAPMGRVKECHSRVGVKGHLNRQRDKHGNRGETLAQGGGQSQAELGQ